MEIAGDDDTFDPLGFQPIHGPVQFFVHVAVVAFAADGYGSDLTVMLGKKTSIEEINETVKAAAEGPMRGIIEYVTDPIVSSDVVHNPHSSLFDSGNTLVMDGDMVKVTMWYDNEWGYSCRTADLAVKMAAL